MKQIQNIYKVISNGKLGEAFHHLVLEAPSLAKAVRPGQFVQIKVSDGLEPFFRRPFSVYRAQSGQVEVLYEPVGPGTRLLAKKKKGDRLDVLGPLGKPFTLPDRSIRQIVFIGGGVGVAPFMLFSDAMASRKAEKLLLYGARSKAHTFSLKAFAASGVKTYVATDDGSVGVKGRVSELFDKIPVGPATMIYACGPKPMLAAVKSWAAGKGLPGEASMEEVMACGLGACLGCSTPTINGYRTVCHDGPVFSLDELVF